MNLLELFKPIRSFVFDIEGVLTDGTLLVSGQGAPAYSLHTRDMYALQKAMAAGYRIIFISESDPAAVCSHLKKTGFKDIYTNIADKAPFLPQLETDLSTTLYMGDDMPDYAAMQLCAIAACPNDAVAEMREKAVYISPRNGGAGCVRDVLEKVLKLNNCW